MILRRSVFVVVFVATAGLFAPATQALVFNFTPASGMDPLAINAFAAGGQRWANLFSDDITVNINIGFEALGTGILGQASSPRVPYTYTDFRTALAVDQFSADDATAITSLPSGTSFGMLINRTSNNPNGSGSDTPYIDNNGDANNATVYMTSANAKALRLRSADDSSTDATITFSSNFTWDFDPTDGIASGNYDFVGIAAHEIGHALGFISGVDILDVNSPPYNGPFNDYQFTFVAPLDLFRYSAESVAEQVIDWTADNRAKYFSLDQGVTSIAPFSLGKYFGDGRQASHWKDSLGLGIMDPTAATSELLTIAPNDLLAFDVIGYNLANLEAVPEPATAALLLFGGLGLATFRRRPRRSVPSR